MRGATVLVGLLGALDEGVELDKGVRPQVRGVVLGGGVGGGELGRKVGEVGECELSGVRAVAYTKKADVVFDDVATGC